MANPQIWVPRFSGSNWIGLREHWQESPANLMRKTQPIPVKIFSNGGSFTTFFQVNSPFLQVFGPQKMLPPPGSGCHRHWHRRCPTPWQRWPPIPRPSWPGGFSNARTIWMSGRKKSSKESPQKYRFLQILHTLPHRIFSMFSALSG